MNTRAEMYARADECEAKGDLDMADCLRKRAPYLNENTRCWHCGKQIDSMMDWVEWPACEEHKTLLPEPVAKAWKELWEEKSRHERH